MPPSTLPDHLRALLGTVPDAEIARRAGCSQANIHQIRSRAGIPAAPRPAKKGGQVNVRFDEEDWAYIAQQAAMTGCSATEAVRAIVHEAARR